mmetsp:Transcript_30295/g.63824  ORF Transcript_30295/g.63824 Transcript_30295/m.63824 type:complete len:286 (-) Transcript_30295:1107-1964(-)
MKQRFLKSAFFGIRTLSFCPGTFGFSKVISSPTDESGGIFTDTFTKFLFFCFVGNSSDVKSLIILTHKLYFRLVSFLRRATFSFSASGFGRSLGLLCFLLLTGVVFATFFGVGVFTIFVFLLWEVIFSSGFRFCFGPDFFRCFFSGSHVDVAFALASLLVCFDFPDDLSLLFILAYFFLMLMADIVVLSFWGCACFFLSGWTITSSLSSILNWFLELFGRPVFSPPYPFPFLAFFDGAITTSSSPLHPSAISNSPTLTKKPSSKSESTPSSERFFNLSSQSVSFP